MCRADGLEGSRWARIGSWKVSSVGRAFPLHGSGREFESLTFYAWDGVLGVVCGGVWWRVGVECEWAGV